MGDRPRRHVQLRETVDRPDLNLVGVLVYSPAKAGLDAGELNRPVGHWCADHRQWLAVGKILQPEAGRGHAAFVNSRH
jgi:hypothetical protein